MTALVGAPRCGTRPARWLISVGLMVALLGAFPVRVMAETVTAGPVTVAGGHGIGAAGDQLDSPFGVAVNDHGDVFVVDTNNDRVQRWAPGATQGVTVAGGSNGSEPSQLHVPYGIALDGAGDVFVSDAGNFRVQEWTPGATEGIAAVNGNGGPSTGGGGLDLPFGVALDTHGNIYIADTGNDRVQKWMPGATSGITVAGGRGPGLADNQTGSPFALAVDSHGDIFVSEYGAARVQEWTPGADRGITVAGGHGSGSAANQLQGPMGVAVDGHGDVFVADVQNHRVQEWTPGSKRGVTVAGGHGAGSAANQLDEPVGVALDGHSHVFVADMTNGRVQRATLPPSPVPVEELAISLSYYTTTSDDQSPAVRTNDHIVVVATLNPANGTNPPTGMVAFYDGSTDLGAVPLYSNGATSYAILFVMPLTAEAHTITDQYTGDNTFTPGHSSSIRITVAP